MRRPIPFDIGPAHFVGIGGIGMSGIAEVMMTLGSAVQGSDMKASANTDKLERLGAKIHIGHRAGNVGNAGVVIISSAVKPDNPEVQEARARGVPVIRRAEMLAELMRLKWTVAIGGTHGKTTTTSMVASLLEAGQLDPTVINGGIINAYGGNAKLGGGDWMVVEADESDGTFTKLRATCAIVTNMDPEHLDHYGTVEAMKQGFLTFVTNIPFYGFAVLCVDHPEVQAMVSKVVDRRVITYGFNPQADVRAVNFRSDGEGSLFDVELRARAAGLTARIEDLRLPMAGRHNAQNALAAIAVARELGVTAEAIRAGLAAFSGVKRRFTTTGLWNGVRIIDDYGHHPVEIAAVLKAAREVTDKKVIAIVQPHRFTRLRDLFDQFCTCMNDADIVAIADVYSAGEAPIDGVDSGALAEGVRNHGHRHVERLGDLADLPAFVQRVAESGDVVVCLGAGDITAHANSLPAKLQAIS